MAIEGADGPVLLSENSPRALLLGVRPEHIRLADHGIAASVDSVEYFGADTIVGARIGNAALLVRVPGQLTLAKGDGVHLVWNAADQHVFDRETGLRRA
jgi:sn-glycerol 3-phosphate transport system ATP-binding protein